LKKKKKQKTASEKYQMPFGKPTNKFVKKTPERRKQKREKTRSRNIDPMIVGAGFKPAVIIGKNEEYD